MSGYRMSVHREQVQAIIEALDEAVGEVAHTPATSVAFAKVRTDLVALRDEPAAAAADV